MEGPPHQSLNLLTVVIRSLYGDFCGSAYPALGVWAVRKMPQLFDHLDPSGQEPRPHNWIMETLLFRSFVSLNLY